MTGTLSVLVVELLGESEDVDKRITSGLRKGFNHIISYDIRYPDYVQDK